MSTETEIRVCAECGASWMRGDLNPQHRADCDIGALHEVLVAAARAMIARRPKPPQP